MNSWPSANFGDVVSTVTPANKIKRSAFLQTGRFPIVSQEAEPINGWWDKAEDLVDIRGPVVIFGDHTRVVKYVDKAFVVGADGVKILQPCDKLLPRFLFYWLSGNVPESLGYARHFRLIAKSTIPLPPLDEQKRIVAKLDEVSLLSDRLELNSTSQLANCKELRAKLLAGVFSEHAPLVPLGDIVEVIAGQSPEGKHYNADGEGLPFYQGKKDFGARSIDPPRVWTREVTKVAEAGDILMSVRAPVGPVNFAVERCCIGRGLAAIRPGTGVLGDFLFHYLESIQSKLEGSEGAVFSSINKSQISAIEVPLPPLAEQKRIIARLEDIDGVRAALLDRLQRQSILVDDFWSATRSALLGGEL